MGASQNMSVCITRIKLLNQYFKIWARFGKFLFWSSLSALLEWRQGLSRCFSLAICSSHAGQKNLRPSSLLLAVHPRNPVLHPFVLIALSVRNSWDKDYGAHITILSAYYELQIQKEKDCVMSLTNLPRAISYKNLTAWWATRLLTLIPQNILPSPHVWQNQSVMLQQYCITSNKVSTVLHPCKILCW